MEQKSTLYISGSIINNLSPMIKYELAKWPVQKQDMFVEEYRKRTKSVGIAYLFLIIILSLHYGYLRKWGIQVLFWITGGGLGIWWLIDLFRLPGLVKNYNNDIAIDTIKDLKIMWN